MAMATRQQNKKRKARNALQRERTVKTLTDAPTPPIAPSLPTLATAAAATGVEVGGGAPILTPTLSASNGNAMAGYPPPFMPSSYPFGFVHPSMPALNGQQAMPVIQPQINPQYYAQFPQQPIPSAPYLPPGKSDLEILQKLKEMILHNQHELYKPIPQPLHLASLYVGPSLSQSVQQADTSPAASSSSHQAQPAAEHPKPVIDTDVQMSDVKSESSPVTIKTSDSSDLASHSALAPAQEAQSVSSASLLQQQQQQQSPVIERSRGPSSVQAREKWEAAKASNAAAQAAAAAATATANPASVDATPVSPTSVTSSAPVSASMTTSQVSQPTSSTGPPNNNLPPKPETVMERKTSFSSSLPAPPSQPPLLRGSSYRPENSYRPGENSYRPGDVDDRDRRDRDYDRRFDRPRITDHRRTASITPNDRHYEPPRYDRYEPGVTDRDRSRPPPPAHDERDRARASVSDEKQENMRSSVPPATAAPVAIDESESIKIESTDKVPPSPLPPATPGHDNDQPAVTATADVAFPALESASPSYSEPPPSVIQFAAIQPAPSLLSDNDDHSVQGQVTTTASSLSPAVAVITAPASTTAPDVVSTTPAQPQATPPPPSNQEIHERSLHDRLSTPVSRPLEERISSASPIADAHRFVSPSSPSATTTIAAPPAADDYPQSPPAQQQPAQIQQQQQQPRQITPATAATVSTPTPAQPATALAPIPISNTSSTNGPLQQPYPQPQPQDQPSYPDITDTRFIPNQAHLAATAAAAARPPAVYEGAKNTTTINPSNNSPQAPLPPPRTATFTPREDARPMLESALSASASVSARGQFSKQPGYSTPPAGMNGSTNGYDYRDRRATPTGGRYSSGSYHGNNSNNNHQHHQQQRGSYTREFQPASAMGVDDHHRARSGPPSSGPGYYGSSSTAAAAAAAAQGGSGGVRNGAYETDVDRRYMSTSMSSPAQHGHAHQHHGGSGGHVDERRDWHPRDGWSSSSSPAPGAAMAGHEQDYWHGGGGGGSGGSGRERYERNDGAKDRVRSNTWDEPHHGHGHGSRGSYGLRHPSSLPLTHPQSEVAQRALLARLGDIPPAPGPNPIVIDDRYSSRADRYPPPPSHPSAPSPIIADDVYGGRIRARSPSPLRRGGVDDVRPPLKRVRDDYSGVVSIPPPHSTGSGSVPGGYYDPRDPAPRALPPPSAGLGVAPGSRGEYPPPSQRAHTQTPPGGAGYYDRSAVYERDYYGVPPPSLSSASAYDRGRYARDPRYDLPPPPRTG